MSCVGKIQNVMNIFHCIVLKHVAFGIIFLGFLVKLGCPLTLREFGSCKIFGFWEALGCQDRVLVLPFLWGIWNERNARIYNDIYLSIPLLWNKDFKHWCGIRLWELLEEVVFHMFIEIDEQCFINFSLFSFLYFFGGLLVLLLRNSSSFK